MRDTHLRGGVSRAGVELGVVVNWYLKYVPGIYQFGGKYKYHS